MTGIEGNLPYAAARVQARHGRRPDDSIWRRIEASRQLGQYLEAVRVSALAPWVARIDAAREAHAIERALRGEWRAYVHRVASWHPRRWQAWLEWWAWLPLLPLLRRLALPAAVPAWMLADPVFGPLAMGTVEQRTAALAATPLAPLAVAVRSGAPVGREWLGQAAPLVPQIDSDTRGHLRALTSLLPDVAATAPHSEAALLRLFRAAAGTAIASGCHLALALLDLERLRGGLVVRSVFPPASAEAA